MLFITAIEILTLGPAIVLCGFFIKNTIAAQLAYLKYKIKLKGLPCCPGRSVFYNHAVSLVMGDDLCNNLLELHRTDGAKNRWLLSDGQLAVVTVDLDMMKSIVLDEPNKHINRPRTHNWTAHEFRFDNLIVARDDQWRRLRRAYAPALRSTKFKAPEVLAEIETSINKLMSGIESFHAQKVGCDGEGFVELPMHELLHRFVLNFIFASFYKQSELIDFKADQCRYTEAIEESMFQVAKNPWIKLGVIMPQVQPVVDALGWYFLPSGVWRRELMGFIERQHKVALGARRQVAAGRTKAGELKRSMIDDVIDQYLDGKITGDEYFHSTAFLLNAADFTTLDTLLHIIYEIGVHPDVQDKLRKSIALEGLDSKYLGWVINETLRILSPAPIGCSREISCDITLESGHVLPAGTMVAMIPNIVHRLKEYWGEDADEFRPERWQDTSRHHPMQYIPFGAGVRQCPGRDLALFEIKRVLVALLGKYEFRAEPDEDVYKFDSPFLVFLNKHSDHKMRVRRI